MEIVTEKPFEIEYEYWFSGAYLQTRRIKTFYCRTTYLEEALKMFGEFKRPYTMFGELEFKILRHSKLIKKPFFTGI